MKMKKVFTGTHRNITYSIENFDFGDGKMDKWTFYLWIRLEQIPKEVRERFWLKGKRKKFSKEGRTHTMYNYDHEGLISGLAWHYGCTWYSKEHGFDGSERCVKIGCDYSHLWDEGNSYDEKLIEFDAKECIDSLYSLIPNIMQPCKYCGRYMKTKEENPTHKKCLVKMESWKNG